MIEQTDLASRFTLSGTSMTVNRMGYGAMQLAGPGVFGPPRDVEGAIAVLREAVESGVNHIDTSDYYGPHVTNQIIKQALHPYPKGLVIVTKLGARRGADASWIPALSRQELIDSAHDNLKNLGLDALDVVNLRVGGFTEPSEGSIEEPLTVLAELKREGLIRHIGLSNVTPKQLTEAQTNTEIVCVQNFYKVAQGKELLYASIRHWRNMFCRFRGGPRTDRCWTSGSWTCSLGCRCQDSRGSRGRGASRLARRSGESAHRSSRCGWRDPYGVQPRLLELWAGSRSR